jgi:hypothetical protein
MRSPSSTVPATSGTVRSRWHWRSWTVTAWPRGCSTSSTAMAAQAWCWSVSAGRTCWSCSRQPWRVLDLARALAKAHLAVHSVHAPGDPPDLRQVLATRIEDTALPPQLRAFACGPRARAGPGCGRDRVGAGVPAGVGCAGGTIRKGSAVHYSDRAGQPDLWGPQSGTAERSAPQRADFPRVKNLTVKQCTPYEAGRPLTGTTVRRVDHPWPRMHNISFRCNQSGHASDWATARSAAVCAGCQRESATLCDRRQGSRRRAVGTSGVHSGAPPWACRRTPTPRASWRARVPSSAAMAPGKGPIEGLPRGSTERWRLWVWTMTSRSTRTPGTRSSTTSRCRRR